MTARYLLFLPLIISFTVTCKSNKNTTKTNDTLASKTEAVANDSTMRFIVSFYSIGSGTEADQEEKLKKFIYEFRESKGKDIQYNVVLYGREGETDYCFPLKELNATEQKEFITSAKNVLKNGKWINYAENQNCRKQN